MITWLLKAIGVRETLTGRLDEVQWLWARPWAVWVGLILLVPIAAFIVVRHRRNLPHVSVPLRSVLSACRIGVLLLLVIVLGGPYLRLEEPVTQKPVVAWMIDESASMDLPVGPYTGPQLADLAVAAGMVERPADGSKPKIDAKVRRDLVNLSRADLLSRVLAHQEQTLLAPLGERFDLRPFRFARGLRPGTGDDVENPGDDDADSQAAPERSDTDLGSALEGAIADAAGRRLAGIVVMTDGRTTTGPDPIQVIRRHQAVTTDASGAPVFAVPVGSPQPPVDIAVLDALVPSRVALNDTAAVVATVGSHGLDGRTVAVRLLEGDTELDTAQLVLRGDQRQQVQLAFDANEPGTRLLTVEVTPQGEEQVKTNNRFGVTVEVDEQRWKVLYLEGYPRWDFRFLDHSLRRDHGLEVTIVMEARLRGDGVKAEDLPKAAHLPEDAAGLAEYNLVILGDITPALLPPRFQEELVKAVEEDGLGLIVQAGPVAMPHAFADGPLGRLLPVRSGSGGGTSAGRRPRTEAPPFAPFQMAVTPSGSIHPAFRLYDSAAQNRGVWSRMPPFYWAAAAGEASPGTTVLAEAKTVGETRPLIAEHFAGAGRVLLIGTDATYRWRRNIGDHLFYRFWGQAMRRVARSKQRRSETSWMEVHPARVEVGENVSIELHAVDAGGRPLADPRVGASVVRGDSSQAVILEGSADPGHFRGMWQTKAVGEYRVVYTDAGGTAVSAAVRVAESGRELVRLEVDRDTLGSLAELSGGDLIELDRLDQLPKRLSGEAVTVRRTHEEELWDNWLVLVLLTLFYCTDVFVRRMSGLA